MTIRYKITAIIIKPGSLPIKWTRFSERRMTLIECEKMFTLPKETGRSFGDKIRIENFCCKKISQTDPLLY
ncbi:TPA: DUF1187 family protein [Escherichia coli]|uniref:DUF1187 family protein n=1 Tax=Escherichia coli TaxID=562 RepID=UPI000B428B35|nr:DUF1187 family protein [Escherichia coli]EFJ8390744.1 DUF1187 family protein [Escherichia coli]EIJ2738282.1 DUF1187 family protein [Escherichia coli]EIX4635446.1 DUF1187 family protein [Escherichia coli]EJL0058009.1 DUF1187 family protein [Escherichia coli]EKS6058854.1 DUF1187 family protein [Escherichia coli]